MIEPSEVESFPVLYFVRNLKLRERAIVDRLQDIDDNSWDTNLHHPLQNKARHRQPVTCRGVRDCTFL